MSRFVIISEQDPYTPIRVRPECVVKYFPLGEQLMIRGDTVKSVVVLANGDMHKVSETLEELDDMLDPLKGEVTPELEVPELCSTCHMPPGASLCCSNCGSVL